MFWKGLTTRGAVIGNQQQRNDNGIANNAGPLNGLTGVSEIFKVSTQTALDRTGLTTRGAVIGGVVGLVTAVVLIVLSKAVWVDTLKCSTLFFSTCRVVSHREEPTAKE
jgi:hypothetical protein